MQDESSSSDGRDRLSPEESFSLVIEKLTMLSFFEWKVIKFRKVSTFESGIISSISSNYYKFSSQVLG